MKKRNGLLWCCWLLSGSTCSPTGRVFAWLVIYHGLASKPRLDKYSFTDALCPHSGITGYVSHFLHTCWSLSGAVLDLESYPGHKFPVEGFIVRSLLCSCSSTLPRSLHCISLFILHLEVEMWFYVRQLSILLRVLSWDDVCWSSGPDDI